jgi:hypothetical protein
MAQLKTLTINDTGFIQLPSGTTEQRPSVPTTGMMRFNTGLGFNELYDGSTWKGMGGELSGLAGKFFNGDWRATISNGNIGTLPLTSTNDSSNVTGTTGLPSANHRYGVNLWTSIAFGNGIGELYGFIAIGYFRPPTTGTYTIYTSSDDGSGVWIGSLALPEATRTSANATLNNGLGIGQGNTKRSATISLTGGTTYPIRIVMEEGGGGDNLTFSWSGPGITETTDLSTYFFALFSPNGTVSSFYM